MNPSETSDWKQKLKEGLLNGTLNKKTGIQFNALVDFIHQERIALLKGIVEELKNVKIIIIPETEWEYRKGYSASLQDAISIVEKYK